MVHFCQIINEEPQSVKRLNMHLHYRQARGGGWSYTLCDASPGTGMPHSMRSAGRDTLMSWRPLWRRRRGVSRRGLAASAVDGVEMMKNDDDFTTNKTN